MPCQDVSLYLIENRPDNNSLEIINGRDLPMTTILSDSDIMKWYYTHTHSTHTHTPHTHTETQTMFSAYLIIREFRLFIISDIIYYDQPLDDSLSNQYRCYI